MSFGDQGFYFWDDFTAFPLTVTNTAEGGKGLYKCFTSDGGLIAEGGESVTEANADANWDVQGVISLYSDGDNEGASLSSNTRPIYINATTKKKMWFEARIKTSSIASLSHGFYVGLSANAAATSATVPIAADGTLEAAGDFCGFYRAEGGLAGLDFIHQQGGVAMVTAVTDHHTIVADAWVKVGFYYDGVKIRPYTNGVEQAYDTAAKIVDNAIIAASGFPDDLALGLQAAVLNGAGTPGTVEMDWWAMAQEG